ncbi:hypothetical protein HY992_04570 [Candidatus Micrarchaeota archaeon]|nr:hypothetical protein [Candidatus Micrarchaeota archaeon]
MVEEVVESKDPKVDGFRVRALRRKSLDDVVRVLSPLEFLEVVGEGDVLVLINVESRDIQRNPYLFSLVYLKPDRIEVKYTITPSMSPSKRRIDVFRFFLNLLTLLGDVYDVDSRELYQLLDGGLKGLTEFASSSYEDVFAKYDHLKADSEMLKKKIDMLSSSNDRLGKDNMDLKNKNDELVLRVKDLETYSDELLEVKIQDWIEEHENSINLSEFCKVYKVNAARVEQLLNKMVMDGVLSGKD